MFWPARARLRIDSVSAAWPELERERPDAALERRDALLEHAGRRVHDPGVDVAELLEPEQARRVRGVVEHVARRGVDRDGARLRRGIDGLAGVEGLRLRPEVAEAAGIVAHLVVCPSVWRSLGAVRSGGGAVPVPACRGFGFGGVRRFVRRNKKTANPVVRGPGTSAPRSLLSRADDQRRRSRRPSSERRGRPRIHMHQEPVVWLIRWPRMGDVAADRQPRAADRNRITTI